MDWVLHGGIQGAAPVRGTRHSVRYDDLVRQSKTYFSTTPNKCR
jgi:hypothetical protein